MSNIALPVINFLNKNVWLVQIWLIVISAFVINSIELSIYRRLSIKLRKTKKIWDDAFLDAVHVPLYSFIWFYAFVNVMPIIFTYWGHFTFFFGFKIEILAFIFALFWCAMRYIYYLEQRMIALSLAQRTKIDITSVRAVAQVSRIILIFITFLLTMNNLGVSIATLLAAGGIGGIALGFASKDMLANFIGGMMIFWDRPFSVGDWIRSPDRQIEGTVENIGWRLTRIATPDKRSLYVPNAIFSNISIENASRVTCRRIYTVVGLRYDDADKMPAILQDIETMLHHHSDIDTTQKIVVKFSELGASSLNFIVYAFTKMTDWVQFQAVRQDVLFKVMEIIAAHKAQCAFPTTTLSMPEGLVIRRQPSGGLEHE